MTSPYDADAEWDDDVGVGDSGYPDESGDSDDLAAALDFSAPAEDDTGVDGPLFVGEGGSEASAGGYVDPYEEAEEPEDSGRLFSVTNPPGTLTVTAYLDGGIQSVQIAPSVTAMTETELAQELLEIAKVAAVKARAGQYEFLLEATPQPAGDREFLGEFLQHGVGLPTPAQAAQVEAEFVQRYLRDDV